MKAAHIFTPVLTVQCCNQASEITRPTKSNTSNPKQDPEVQFLLGIMR